MRFTKSTRQGVALLVLAGSAVALLPTPAPADTLSTFDARAAAAGVDVTVANASIPLGLVVQGTAPVARTALDSLGTSEALAAGPYPGDLAASLPGTVRTTSGIPLPDYPLVVATSAGDNPKEVVAPGVSLHAESRSRRSASRATVGSESTGSTSTADAERDDAGGVQATAIARSDVLRVLDRLTLSGVVAEASTSLDEAGTRTSRSSLRIDAISAAGLVVAVPATTPKGGLPDMPPLISGQPALPKPPPSEPTPLPGGGTTVTGPVLRFADGQFTVVSGTGGPPTQGPVPAAAVAAAFRALGIEMTYEAAQPTATGIVAPVLSFRTTLSALPDNPTAFQGPTTVVVDIGRVTTSVAGQAIPDAGIGVDPIAGLPAPPGPAAPSEASSPAADLDAGDAAIAGVATGLGPEIGALAGGELTSAPEPAPGASQAAAPAPATAPKLARAVGRTVNVRKVYVLFMALAGVGLVAGSLVRRVGVRF
jgi:S-DNA-T family DNA segregation ATPase FtsK/SpoIIIE